MELKVFLRERVQNGEGMCANHSVFLVNEFIHLSTVALYKGYALNAGMEAGSYKRA